MTSNRLIFLFALAIGLGSFANAQESKLDEKPKQPAVDVGNRDVMKLPGLEVHTREGYVDVDATVCLGSGLLELIACTKDSKEHESIVAVGAKPSHIHAALLLLGAQPGSPARPGRFGPSGSEVDVFLVFKDAEGHMKEHPISDFIERSGEEDIYGKEVPEAEAEKRFPTHTFLFAGSQLYKGEDGKTMYLSDQSGNVISLATFGDELLCLPGEHSQDNGELSWEIDPTHLPEVGTKVILRLRPKQEQADAPEEETETPKP